MPSTRLSPPGKMTQGTYGTYHIVDIDILIRQYSKNASDLSFIRCQPPEGFKSFKCSDLREGYRRLASQNLQRVPGCQQHHAGLKVIGRQDGWHSEDQRQTFRLGDQRSPTSVTTTRLPIYHLSINCDASENQAQSILSHRD